jgi:iron complex transport system permease protein
MRRATIVLLILPLLVLAAAVITPLVGTSGAPLSAVFWQIRAPRLVMAMLAGAALSLGGMIFQAIFRNPLASPFTLGVASGASLAAAVAIRLNIAALWWAISAQMGLAFAGAMTTVLIVYAIARARRGFATATLLLAGVSIGFVCSATIVLIQYLSGEHEATAIIRWLMGSVEVVGTQGWLSMIPVAVLVAIGALLSWYLHRALDLLMMGEATAASRGLNVPRARALAYFAASTMTGAVVALCGPIAFVGLVVPHVLRFLVGPSHNLLMPGCLLGGMIFLPTCDMVARNLMGWLTGSSLQLPVGVLTNLIGGAFFLYILLTRRQESPLL